MSKADVATTLTSFIRERFLAGDPNGELELDSPLLKWGVLDSLNVAVLMSFIRDELKVEIPPVSLTAENFRDVRSITALVLDLAESNRQVKETA